MASMREIKRRRDSINSTKQITNAMKLVATARLGKAKGSVLATRPYFNKIYETIGSIISQSKGIDHDYLTVREGTRTAYIVITSNRGLAGGYNNNIIKLVIQKEEEERSQASYFYAVGKKGRDLLRGRNYEVLESYQEAIEKPSIGAARNIGKAIMDKFIAGELDRVYIVYTRFDSIITQTPAIIKLLPLSREDFELGEEEPLLTEYEPSPEEVLAQMIPQYVNSIIYGALIESRASEHGARQTAMDSATKNADEMIDKLTLQYNRARQAAITQELSEIVAGAEALK